MKLSGVVKCGWENVLAKEFLEKLKNKKVEIFGYPVQWCQRGMNKI